MFGSGSNEAGIATGMPRRHWSDEGNKGRCDVSRLEARVAFEDGAFPQLIVSQSQTGSTPATILRQMECHHSSSAKQKNHETTIASLIQIVAMQNLTYLFETFASFSLPFV